MGLAGTVIQNIGAKKRNEQQFNQQKALMDKSFEQNQSMALFNKDLQMQLWKDTGPTGQMEQLKAAGLNPGLIYGMGGAGGQTAAAAAGQGQGTPTANVENTMAGMGIAGMQIGAQIELLKAQKENIEADTGKKIAETPGAGQIPEKIGAEIADIKQGINNKKSLQRLTDVQSDIADLEQQYKSATLEQSIANYANEASRIWANARSAMAQADVDDTTKETRINQIAANLADTLTGITLKQAQTDLAKSGITLNDAQIQNFTETQSFNRMQLGQMDESQTRQFREQIADNLESHLNIPAETAKQLGQKIIQALTLGGILKGDLKNATPKQESNSNIFKYKQGDKLKSGTKFTY